jgi:hypothetical protein
MPRGGSKLARLMAARSTSRIVLNGALLAVVLACPVLMCVPVCDAGEQRVADGPQAEKNRGERERCKRTEGRAPPKGCPDGGERLPQDKRSPLDTIPPLSPLVA